MQTETRSEAQQQAHCHYVLRLADTSLVLGQRLAEWIGHAPALEEDLALANLSLDLIGQARLLLTYAGELEGQGRDEDALAFLRDAPEFLNLALAEQPNGDFAHTIVRQWLIDAWQLEIYGALEHSSDTRLAAIAAKAIRETRYHYRFSSGWLVRLGDGTEESHRRVQESVDALWPFTHELFAADEVDEHLAAEGIEPHQGVSLLCVEELGAAAHRSGRCAHAPDLLAAEQVQAGEIFAGFDHQPALFERNGAPGTGCRLAPDLAIDEAADPPVRQ